MTPSKHERQALREILRRAYHERENVEVGDQWQEEVMRRIRELDEIDQALL
jgi:hypothetical protein